MIPSTDFPPYRQGKKVREPAPTNHRGEDSRGTTLIIPFRISQEPYNGGQAVRLAAARSEVAAPDTVPQGFHSPLLAEGRHPTLVSSLHFAVSEGIIAHIFPLSTVVSRQMPEISAEIGLPAKRETAITQHCQPSLCCIF